MQLALFPVPPISYRGLRLGLLTEMGEADGLERHRLQAQLHRVEESELNHLHDNCAAEHLTAVELARQTATPDEHVWRA